MGRKKKIIIGCILICLVCIIGAYKYVNNNQKNNFKISQVSWNGDTKIWTDNTQNNIYDIKFQIFDGTDLKEITSEKSTYAMKIDSTAENGELKIKIYNDKKILFEKNGTMNKTITISNGDSKNVKIEITGKKSKGHIKIKLT
ncbi:hypothetical protein K2F40_12495 [Clostridium sp. CM028]|uniref:hypothetical protein n=1 Tax=Clostridium sp. CM028 TaxID=2851575 RepID=UPI001C6DED60|nr:hypothetical protein [Clostridium sp. CM028]MBW9149778.1 hypothetical protein [Clostridium sp. CM028]WLC62724.1 hypothetical protein KTC94_05535 [Clostridium sp. CM028]